MKNLLRLLALFFVLGLVTTSCEDDEFDTNSDRETKNLIIEYGDNEL